VFVIAAFKMFKEIIFVLYFCHLSFLQLEGKIVAPSKVDWKAQSYWISVISVDGLTIEGNGRGVVDGDGSTWWQCNCDRPGVCIILNNIETHTHTPIKKRD